MAFLTAYHTDKGIKKKTNQDALLLKSARTPRGQVGFFVICDGMGGLTQGELASATVVEHLSEWFDHELPGLLERETQETELSIRLEQVINEVNRKILNHGEGSNVQLGTTLTALLMVYSSYILVQIGDSRAYMLNDDTLTQLTKDQTLVQRELEKGNITEDQARVDPRRNVLLQCVGATKELKPVVSTGTVESGSGFLLCSDGFYHEMTDGEIVASLKPAVISNENALQDTVKDLVEKVKARKEKDNISVIFTQVT
ncbi:serine/threonine protein phosphatase PrpC [Bacillus tianshenii]|uniref:Serine/threonine protein phosphatase PrpC n=1 Tax=Sutcliffiella tianshenii TaxID=1463404 RepID=A0ABS2NUW7_9BACI|nr:protein phosphatase 2C domain-containing protein [Bacillus tianshenii]MBM7618441.1 serine/threonine protein phosphatase PrpC [Bacillus tianshenii]